MNWFNVLKNQVASTKGKTFQLDYTQPMIEENNCRDEFTQLTKKAINVNVGKEYDAGENYKFLLLNKTPLLIEFALPENLSYEVPEEVYCRALELYKSNEDYHDEMFNGYFIRVGLSTKRQKEYLNGKATGKTFIRIYRKHCMIMKGRFEEEQYSHGFIFDLDVMPTTNPEDVDEFFRMVKTI